MMLGAGGATALKVVVPAAELALLIPLAVTAPHRHAAESGTRRTAAICLTGILSAANMLALRLLVHHLVHGNVGGGQLLLAAGQVWGTTSSRLRSGTGSSMRAVPRDGSPILAGRVTSRSRR